jgi:N-acetyl-gamma-glutamyl-phosphate reductase
VIVAMVRVAILGATGYAAKEAIRLLLGHPGAEITALTTRQSDEPPLGEVHPSLRGRLDLRLENLDAAELCRRADCVFCCLPHAASAEIIKDLLPQGTRVVDLSADYRLNDAAVYRKWYDHEHPDPARLPETVYGLPELYRDRIPPAQLVANPGCYPTSAILPLAPLLREGLIAAEGIIIDSKSGVSGAGRTTKAHLHFPECNENFSAYGVGGHRHTPEIDQVLTDHGGRPTEVVFTPHLTPMDRGILTTAYATPTGAIDTAGVLEALRRRYADEPFVRVVEGLPGTKDVVGTNFCDLTARVVRGRVVLISVIDNLIKGAAGAAVQNFNLMYGFDETTAL